MRDSDRDELATYIREKVKEEAVRQANRVGRSPQKVTPSNNRHQHLEDVLRSNEILREKEDKIKDLRSELETVSEEMHQKNLEIKHLSNYIEDVKNKHKLDIEKQMQFNTANDKTLRRLTERERETALALKKMNNDMADNIKKYSESHINSHMYDMDISPTDQAKSNLSKILTLLEELYMYKEKCDNMSFERTSILRILEVDEDKMAGTNVLQILKASLANQDLAMRKADTDNKGLQEQLDFLVKKQEEDNSPSLQNQISVLEGIKDAFKEDITAKEEVIKNLTEENAALKSKMEQISQNHNQSHSQSQNENQKQNQSQNGGAPNQGVAVPVQKPKTGGVRFADKPAGKVGFSDPAEKARTVRLAQGRPPPPRTPVTQRTKRNVVVMRRSTPFRMKQTPSTDSVSGSEDLEVSSSSSEEEGDGERVGPFITRSVMARVMQNQASSNQNNNFVNQGLYLPPLHRQLEFRVANQPSQPSYQHPKGQMIMKGSVSKTTHSMSTGATKVSQSELMNSKNFIHIQAAGNRPQVGGSVNMLQVSTFNKGDNSTKGKQPVKPHTNPAVNRPKRQVGFRAGTYSTQQTTEMKRNVSFFR